MRQAAGHRAGHTIEPRFQPLADLGVTRYRWAADGSRTDNPLSEVRFQTVNTAWSSPGRFGSIDEAKDFCRKFF